MTIHIDGWFWGLVAIGFLVPMVLAGIALGAGLWWGISKLIYRTYWARQVRRWWNRTRPANFGPWDVA